MIRSSPRSVLRSRSGSCAESAATPTMLTLAGVRAANLYRAVGLRCMRIERNGRGELHVVQ